MFTNNLLLYYLMDNGLKVDKGNITKDIICLDFDFATRSYKETYKSLSTKYENETNIDNKEKLKYALEKVELQKDKYVKVSKDEIRKEYYNNGVDITYITRNKNGDVKKSTTIHYMMLYRSNGKAKNGSCIFINKRLYKKAHDFLYMGTKLPKKKAQIVEMSAYSSLIASSIVDTVKINPQNILILKDVDSFFKRDVVSVETNYKKQCIARRLNDYELSNTLFDGQALIDSNIFPSWGNGYILLRHHMCKMAAFSSNIQLFFKDYYGDNYMNAKVVDMFGNEHYAKDIELITTDNAMKWLKFGISYEKWCEKIFDNDCLFGIVKTAHKSKLGAVQKMSYQMINALDLDIMESTSLTSYDYIVQLKKDNKIFLQYLRDNCNFSNDFDVLVALCEQNWDFTRSEYFRNRKKAIIYDYVRRIKSGKLIEKGDNLVIVGSPYAMLLHSVGENVNKDTTFSQNSDYIECYTKRFKCGESIAGFRNPFNSKNNMSALYNVYDDRLERYFNITEQIIAVNMIGTDFQDRNNGLTKWVSLQKCK